MFQLIIRWLFMGCGYITHFYCKIRNYSIITIVLPLIVIMSVIIDMHTQCILYICIIIHASLGTDSSARG